MERTQGVFAEQIIRPTGLIDPPVEIKPVEEQVDDLINEAKITAAAGYRTLVTTLDQTHGRGSDRIPSRYLLDGTAS